MTIKTKDGTTFILSTGHDGKTYLEFGNTAGVITRSPHVTRGHELKIYVCLFEEDGTLGPEKLITSPSVVDKIN